MQEILYFIKIRERERERERDIHRIKSRFPFYIFYVCLTYKMFKNLKFPNLNIKFMQKRFRWKINVLQGSKVKHFVKEYKNVKEKNIYDF